VADVTVLRAPPPPVESLPITGVGLMLTALEAHALTDILARISGAGAEDVLYRVYDKLDNAGLGLAHNPDLGYIVQGTLTITDDLAGTRP